MPKNSNVGRCVDKVEKQPGKDKVAAIKICQASTGQSYKTGKKSKTVKESMEKKRIVEFIKSVVDKDFAAANEKLQNVVDEKIKTRIRNYNVSLEKDTEK